MVIRAAEPQPSVLEVDGRQGMIVTVLLVSVTKVSPNHGTIYIGPCAKQRSKNGHWRDQECVLNTVRWCVQNEGMSNSAILVGIRMHSTNDYC